MSCGQKFILKVNILNQSYITTKPLLVLNETFVFTVSSDESNESLPCLLHD